MRDEIKKLVGLVCLISCFAIFFLEYTVAAYPPPLLKAAGTPGRATVKIPNFNTSGCTSHGGCFVVTAISN